MFDQSVPYADDDAWELYHVAEDASECHDVAAEHPEKLRELVDKWWKEAERNDVLPVDNAPFADAFSEVRPHTRPRNRYVYHPFAGPVAEEAAVNVRNRSHIITAEISVDDGTPLEGILLAQGSIYCGYVLFVQDRRLHYVHNFVGLEQHRVSAALDLASGEHTLGFAFTKTGDHRGTGALVVDGRQVAEVDIPRFTPTRFSITGEGLCCGYDMGMPVVEDYRTPFAFTARLHRVVVDVGGEPFVDPEAEVDLSLRAQ
jgi:arylsulfatase